MELVDCRISCSKIRLLFPVPPVGLQPAQCREVTGVGLAAGMALLDTKAACQQVVEMAFALAAILRECHLTAWRVDSQPLHSIPTTL